MKRLKEGDFGWGSFYTYMGMEYRNLLKLFQRKWKKRENNGWNESKQGTIYVYIYIYMYIYMKPPV
jgi:hypothetical protein